MKTIAIIESCDTKFKETAYMREFIEKQGMKVIVLDVSTGQSSSYEYDISREEIVENAGAKWKDLALKTKAEKISFMTEAVAVYVELLYKEGKINGILSVGGLQNTVMATNAMKRLPISFLKLWLHSRIGGNKTFDSVVEIKIL